MTTNHILTTNERKIYAFIEFSKPHVEQSKIIDTFSGTYNTFESAQVSIGQILKKLHIYELIERVPATTPKTFKQNINVWRVTKKP